MTILVTGATGTVGRHIVQQLVERGEHVRALTRDPRATFPDGVEVAVGDLSVPRTLAPALEGVTGLHLITLGAFHAGPELVELATAAGVRRVSVLSGWEETSVEKALRASSLGWTQIQCVEFMANALDWAPSIREEGVVRVFGDTPGAVVHEADIAAVAVTALVDGGHEGRCYELTGPQSLTPFERVRQIGAAIGREIRYEALTEAEFRLAMQGWDADYIEFAVQLRANPPEVGSIVQPTVAQVTGRPARTFTQWAAQNAAVFLTQGESR